MPRFKSKGTLERTALADLWKHTLSQIPTLYGRLAYLASLRDPNSGAYRHHGLSAAFGREESGEALKHSHERIFSEWLTLALADKSRDLGNYLRGLDDPQGMVAGHWLRSDRYRAQIPDSARPMESELFQRDLEALLQILRNASAAEPPAPGSGQSS
jgi:hypothetical protein